MSSFATLEYKVLLSSHKPFKPVIFFLPSYISTLKLSVLIRRPRDIPGTNYVIQAAVGETEKKTWYNCTYSLPLFYLPMCTDINFCGPESNYLQNHCPRPTSIDSWFFRQGFCSDAYRVAKAIPKTIRKCTVEELAKRDGQFTRAFVQRCRRRHSTYRVPGIYSYYVGQSESNFSNSPGVLLFSVGTRFEIADIRLHY